jgi:ribosomal protein L5
LIVFCRQDEEEEEALVDDISTSPEPKLRKLAPVSEDESPVSSKPAAASAKKIVLNRHVVAPTASSEKENQQQQMAQGISDTGQQPQQSDAKKVIKLSAFSMKEVGDVFGQY